MGKVSFNVSWTGSYFGDDYVWDEPLQCDFEEDFNGGRKIGYLRVRKESINFYHGVLDSTFKNQNIVRNTEIDMFLQSRNLPLDTELFVSRLEISTDFSKLCSSKIFNVR